MSGTSGEPQVVVLDASVGVKWFRDETGTVEARDLRRRHVEGEILIAVDSLFFYEVMRAASRDAQPSDAVRIWRDLQALGLAEVPLADEIVLAAAQVRIGTGCALYDAFPAALAQLLDAPLYSADMRAHSGLENVVLLGA